MTRVVTAIAWVAGRITVGTVQRSAMVRNRKHRRIACSI